MVAKDTSDTIITQIGNVTGEVKRKGDARLREFSSFSGRGNDAWFSELCFCILTANSKARTALAIQRELGCKGFCELPQQRLAAFIRASKHRFHNNKAAYICSARKHFDIKKKITELAKTGGETAARDWLVANVNGLGYKEASHFLRNVGYFGLAILDRHILNLMSENKIIDAVPKTLTRARYLEIENRFIKLAKRLKMEPARLDLIMWYLKAGEVLK